MEKSQNMPEKYQKNYDIAKTDLSEDFKELSFIGGGGQGIVIKGIYKGEIVAIKQILSLGKETKDFYMQREQYINAILQDQPKEKLQNVLVCQKIIYRNNNVYIVMDLFETNLLDFLPKKNKDDLEDKYRIEIIYKILQGVKQLHNLNIVHRDLKPQNILVKRDSKGQLIIKISDFGLSKQINGQNSKHSNDIGTPTYRYPYFNTRDDFTVYEMKQQDIYSLGLVFFLVLTGKEPKFHGKMNNMKEYEKGLQRFYESNYETLEGQKKTFMKDIIRKMIQLNKKLEANILDLNDICFKNQQQQTSQNFGDIYYKEQIKTNDMSIESSNQLQSNINQIDAYSISECKQTSGSSSEVLYQNAQVYLQSQNK